MVVSPDWLGLKLLGAESRPECARLRPPVGRRRRWIPAPSSRSCGRPTRPGGSRSPSCRRTLPPFGVGVVIVCSTTCCPTWTVIACFPSAVEARLRDGANEQVEHVAPADPPRGRDGDQIGAGGKRAADLPSGLALLDRRTVQGLQRQREAGVGLECHADGALLADVEAVQVDDAMPPPDRLPFGVGPVAPSAGCPAPGRQAPPPAAWRW